MINKLLTLRFMMLLMSVVFNVLLLLLLNYVCIKNHLANGYIEELEQVLVENDIEAADVADTCTDYHLY